MSKLDDVRARINGNPSLGKKMAKYGAIGAVVAIPLPFIGPVIGATLGAGIAYLRRDKA